MKKARLSQKQYLELQDAFEIDETKCVDSELVSSVIEQLSKQKQIVFGMNSVNKSLKKDQIQIMILPSDIARITVAQMIYSMAFIKEIPIVLTSMTSKELGEKINVKVASVIGVLKSAAEETITEISHFSSFVQKKTSLPNLHIKTDFFYPSVSSKSKRK